MWSGISLSVVLRYPSMRWLQLVQYYTFGNFRSLVDLVEAELYIDRLRRWWKLGCAAPTKSSFKKRNPRITLGTVPGPGHARPPFDSLGWAGHPAYVILSLVLHGRFQGVASQHEDGLNMDADGKSMFTSLGCFLLAKHWKLCCTAITTICTTPKTAQPLEYNKMTSRRCGRNSWSQIWSASTAVF